MVAEGVNRRSFARLAGEGTFQVQLLLEIRNRASLWFRTINYDHFVYSEIQVLKRPSHKMKTDSSVQKCASGSILFHEYLLFVQMAKIQNLSNVVNAEVATVMGSIPASSDTVESDGRQMTQC
jgi:hypothetical protein